METFPIRSIMRLDLFRLKGFSGGCGDLRTRGLAGGGGGFRQLGRGNLGKRAVVLLMVIALPRWSSPQGCPGRDRQDGEVGRCGMSGE